jgi:hypothetical protein
MNKITSSLKEPSSWAGLAAIASQVGPLLGLANPITGAIVGVCGLVAWVLREKGAQVAPPAQ